MVFTTPDFVKQLRRQAQNLHGCLAPAPLLWMLALSGCTQASNDFGFAIDDVEASWRGGHLVVSTRQLLRLSGEAREALVNGVPLTIDLMMVIKDPVSNENLKTHTASFEVRYLPLSDHYQLSGNGLSATVGDDIRTYPRLRHVLAELNDIDINIDTGSLAPGEYPLLTRTRLNLRKVPAPMRLPVLFSGDWNHDSNWSTWITGTAPKTLTQGNITS
jgi:hypothetical protein